MKRKLDLISDGPSLKPGMRAITLNPREKQFKGLLLDVARRIDDKAKAEAAGAVTTGPATEPEPVVLRWAGGWVRDKLLGIESHDIDVAINTMTGEVFTNQLVEFCADPANVERHGITPGDIGNLHKVAANPDKSKHLETVATRMFGIEVDFVNLRKETYAQDSRNPQMEFGTAEEDALRRDATVNALFYNLNTDEIEDFVGGTPDLDRKLIRTPLEPLQTFTDDPLRVLRLVRFASRLGFSIDPAAEATMSNPAVLEALRLKISRERVGIEVDKMLKGKHPRDSLRLIERLGLYNAVFVDPTRRQEGVPTPDLSRWAAAYECMDHLAGNRTPGSIYSVLVRTEEDAAFGWTIAALLPWEALPAAAEVPTKGTHTLPLATLAAREGIRAGNKLCDIVTAMHRNRAQIEDLKRAVCAGEARARQRDLMGMAVRAWDTRTGNWRLQVLGVALLEVMQRSGTGDSAQCKDRALDTQPAPRKVENKTHQADQPLGNSAARNEVLAGWQKFLDHLDELDVLEAPSFKRLVDGKMLSKALGVKPGRWMTPAMDVCMEWQLRNPGVTDTAGAIDEVRKRVDELGIVGVAKPKG
ncbi:hypothetical protein RB595_001965 [Gaeumannomyces hyphopodioides]